MKYKSIVIFSGLILIDLWWQWLSMNNGWGMLNKGISGGVGSNVEWWFWVVLQGIMVIWLYRRYIESPDWGWWAIICGALGNIVSRLIWGGVVDYINLGIFHNNISDIMIAIGAVRILWKK